MKNTPFTPAGRAFKGHNFKSLDSVMPFKKHAPEVSLSSDSTVPHYLSVEQMVHEMRPVNPIQCLRPDTITSIASWFVHNFCGDTMFAVKTNPDAAVLQYLQRAGIRHYDVASLAEIKLVADNVSNPHMYFMHPVKSREAIAEAYYKYGVRDFSLDCEAELTKIIEVTNHASDLNLYVRVAIGNDNAAYSLSGKFGVDIAKADFLLQATRAVAKRMGICFHVGSQCMNPDDYTKAIKASADLVKRADVKVDVLDIGGGFPSVYPGLTPPPLDIYMQVINSAIAAQTTFADCQIICEPGRALVAEGGSIVVRVDLRKDNMLYINDGTYGSLFDAGVPGFTYPVKAICPEGGLSDELEAFGFYGPTCDSIDVMKGPFHLPKNIGEGDWIEIGQLGAYGATMRTNFNGFYTDEKVEVSDKPLLSIFAIN